MITLQTGRLVIRNFRPDDGEALHEMIAQYQTSAYAPYDHAWPTSLQEIEGVAAWFAGGDRFLAVCLKGEPDREEAARLIGFVSLNPEESEAEPTYNLGYVFNFDYHGQGYAAEACRALLGHAFTRLGAQRVVTGTAAANGPSCRLLERLGFTKTGESMGSLRKDAAGNPIEFLGYSYALSREAWEGLGKEG